MAPAKFCQRLRVIKSVTQSIALTRKVCITVIKKTIQRNHMFAVFALLLEPEDAFFFFFFLFFLFFFLLLTSSAFFAYSEYRFEGWLLYFHGILSLKYCSLLFNLNLLNITLG